MITTIVFDLGNVLIPFNLKKTVEQFVAASQAPYWQIIYFFTRSEFDKQFVEGYISAEEFFAAAKRELQMNMSFDDFKQHYNAIFDHNLELEELVKQLSSHYTLAILSNTNQLHFDFIKEAYPIMQEFEEYILSYKEHCQKPSYEIFTRLLSRLDAAPQQVLFVDDIEANVVSAEQIGIRGIQYTNVEELVGKMGKYGVKL